MNKAQIHQLFPMHEFKILDAEAHRAWEDMLGIPLQGDTISLTHETYRPLAEKIQIIQLEAVLRTGNY